MVVRQEIFAIAALQVDGVNGFPPAFELLIAASGLKGIGYKEK